MFHWVELRAFVHATEDEEKVVAAMRTVMADGDLRRDVLEGHFRNPLVALTVRTEKAAEVREFGRRLLAAMGKEQVLDDLAARIDEDSVYHLRVDKQRAYLGKI
ncbi:MAG TPA: RNA-binding domain-containing protein, partial [Thermoplasmata archaeon]|nr:RNA-binding domain-containing protein [Thermoplasmata archaeon]